MNHKEVLEVKRELLRKVELDRKQECLERFRRSFDNWLLTTDNSFFVNSCGLSKKEVKEIIRDNYDLKFKLRHHSGSHFVFSLKKKINFLGLEVWI